MFKSLKNILFNEPVIVEAENKVIIETEDEQFKKKSLEEKAIIVSELFSLKIKDTYDFDYVDITIEDQKDIKYNSNTYKQLARFGFLLDIKDEFSFNKYILENGFISTQEKKVVIFLMSRRYSDMNENKMMIGYILNDGNILFNKDFNQDIFEHFMWNGKIKNNKGDKNNYYNYSYYIYRYKDNKFLYNTDIILEEKFHSLHLRAAKNNNYFPAKRTYLLSFSLNIEKQDCFLYSLQAVANLTYKEEKLRTLEFTVNDETDFLKAINRMLFPYNLELDKLKELGLSNLDIKDIKNLFEDEFKIYNMIEI